MKRTILCILLITALLFSASAVSFGGMKSTGYDDTFPIYFNGKSTGYFGYSYRGNIYLTPQTLKALGDCSKVTFDTDNRRMTFHIADFDFSMADEETTEFVKENFGEGYIRIASWNQNIKYVVSLPAIEKLVNLTGYLDYDAKRICLYPYNKGNGKLSVLTSDVEFTPTFATFTTDVQTLKAGTPVYFQSETEHFAKVTTTGNLSGYVLKSLLTPSTADLSDVGFILPKKVSQLSTDTPFSAAWVYCGMNVSTQEISEKHAGLDVLQPTWLRLLVEEGGAVQNDSDAGFTRTAHANGYQVWGTVTNNFSASGSSNFTYKMFMNEDIMNRTIAQYLFYAALYDWDGINVDFEQIEPWQNVNGKLVTTSEETQNTRKGFVKFLSVLTDYAHRQGLVVSVDPPTVQAYYPEFDFAEIGKICDYVMMMAYDQHYSGSSNAGSVADLKWTEDSVKNMIALVPAEKVVLGVPLYTRLWVTQKSNTKNVRNASVTMTSMQELISKNNLSPVWKTSEKQYYVEWPESSDVALINRVWIEDARSIAYRLDLVQKYHLAGTACWSYDNGTDEIWDVFDAMLHNDEPLSTFDVDLY